MACWPHLIALWAVLAATAAGGLIGRASGQQLAGPPLDEPPADESMGAPANQEPANNEKPFASMLNLAVINGNVSLPCDISPASADDSVALILWYKDDSLAPIYTIDARKASSLDKAKTSLDEVYTNRATFNTRARPALLQLEPVRQEDEGEYRCRVDFRRGRTVNTIIGLRVVVPPDDIRIVAQQRPHARLEGLIGPFNEGAELTLVCLAQGGKPRPQISWRRDFNVIDETYQHLDKEGTSNELKIPSLNKNHLLSIFTCQASNNNITSPLQTSITLDLNLKPQEVSLRQVGQEPLVVGQTATFECLTHGSRPAASIHWLFQGSRQDAPVNVDQHQTSSRLTLTLQRSFNQQPLTCVAENARIAQASALRQTIKLDVHYAPQLSIKLESSLNGGSSAGAGPITPAADQTPHLKTTALQEPAQQQQQHLQEGNDIYLTCQLDANPRPLKAILWRFQGRPIQAPASGAIVMTNQSLVLRKVSRHQSGAYTCEASNQHGSNTSRPLELVIRHAPVCATDDILVLEASPGQTLAIDCGVLANPARSVHHSWFMAAGERNLSAWLQREAALDEQIDESSARLRLRVDSANVNALLKCKAKNEIGLQQRACLFRLVRARAPQLRHSCALLQAGAHSLQVSCEPNEHLKTEDFELAQPAGGGADPEAAAPNATGPGSARALAANRGPLGVAPGGLLASWLDAGWRSAEAPAEPRAPSMRLVYPPAWLLAELYRLSPASAGGAAGQPEAAQEAQELVAYVIVGAGAQLARIKALVEEERLFSGNPRGVYYVVAHPAPGASEPALANSTLAAELASAGWLHQASRRAGAGALLDAHQHQAHQQLYQQQQQQPLAGPLVEDASVQLASAFTFTVPSLEPARRYRLLIYGQNVANRTRDWQVVRGETLPEEPLGFTGRANELLQAAGAHQLADQTSAGASGERGAQKSLVMRSDGHELASSSGSGEPADAGLAPASGQPAEGHAPAEQQPDSQRHRQQPTGKHLVPSSAPSSPASGPSIDRLLGGGSLRLGERLQQLGLFRDYAISYARQKPLLAVPIAALGVLLLSMLLVYASGFLVQLARCGGGGQGGGSAAAAGSRRARGRRDSRTKPGASSPGSAQGQLTASSSDESDLSKSAAGALQRPGAKCQPGASVSPGASYASSSNQDQQTTANSMGALLMAAAATANNKAHLQLQAHPAHGRTINTGGCQQPEAPAFQLELEPGPHEALEQHQQQYQPAVVYTIEADPGGRGAALGAPQPDHASMRLYPAGLPDPKKVYPMATNMWAASAGSLDRRAGHAFAAAHGQLLQVMPAGELEGAETQSLLHQLNRQLLQARACTGSIDRRAGSLAGHTFAHPAEHFSVPRHQRATDDFFVAASGELAPPAAMAAHHAHVHASQFAPGERDPYRAAARRQRVAFDLSGTTADEPAHLAARARLESVSSSSEPTAGAAPRQTIVAGAQQRQQRLFVAGRNQPPAAPPALSCKNSDSGASNSGTTADSGHESPATTGGETTSIGVGQLLVQRPPADKMARCARHQLAEQHHYQHHNHVGGDESGLVMLMEELSPGSQESASTTLGITHSVDSFGSGAPAMVHHGIQEVATSFTSSAAASAAPDTLQVHLRESKDLDHWL